MTMRILTRDEIRDLIEPRPGPCVSVFLPMHPGSREQRQDEIRLKNLLSQGTDELLERGLRRPAAEEILAPLQELLHGQEFRRFGSQGLACFCAPNFFGAFQIPLQLREELFVSDRFHVKPLLPMMRADSRFYVLSLTQDKASLFEATRHAINEVELPFIESVEIDGTEQAHQYHSHRSPSQGKGQTAEAIYHGHGGPEDRSKTELLHHFQRVNRSVMEVLHDQHAPLALACVGYLAPIYESANSYPHLLRAKVPGSPDRWSQDELLQHAWQLVQPYLLRQQAEALAEFDRRRHEARTSDDIRDIVLASDSGRVDALFVQQGAEQWGHVEPELQAVHIYDSADQGEEELLDFAVARTLANGGEVYALEQIPNTDSPLAATYRY